jgi:hypothetical protein
MSQLFVSAFVLAVLGGGGTGPEIVNPRATYGHLGAPRPKEGFLPGDVAHFSFQIKNLKADAKDRVSYSIAIVIADEKGKVFFEQKPYNSFAQNFFGGNALPAAARVEVPLDTKPGAMNWKVTVTDRTTGKSTELKGQGKVLPADFGLVQVGTFADVEGKVPVPPVGVVGSQLHLGFGVVGFGRGKDKQPDIKISLRIRDEKGQLTTANPLTGEVNKDIPADARVVPMHFGLALDRAGRFMIELSAHDETSGKTSMVQFPVRILASE